jgi:tetratricopeptide (TPR) repeat protein
MGLIYHKEEKLEKAVEAYKKAIRYKPGLKEAYGNIAAAYRQLGNGEEAQKWEDARGR